MRTADALASLKTRVARCIVCGSLHGQRAQSEAPLFPVSPLFAPVPTMGGSSHPDCVARQGLREEVGRLGSGRLTGVQRKRS